MKQTDLFAKCYARIDRAGAHSARTAELWNEIPPEELSETEVSVEEHGAGTLWLRPKNSVWPQELELELGESIFTSSEPLWMVRSKLAP